MIVTYVCYGTLHIVTPFKIKTEIPSTQFYKIHVCLLIKQPIYHTEIKKRFNFEGLLSVKMIKIINLKGSLKTLT